MLVDNIINIIINIVNNVWSMTYICLCSLSFVSPTYIYIIWLIIFFACGSIYTLYKFEINISVFEMKLFQFMWFFSS